MNIPDGSDSEESSYNVGDLGWSLGQEDPMEKEMTTHSSILTWTIPWREEPSGLQSIGCKESDRTEWLTLHFIYVYFIMHIT